MMLHQSYLFNTPSNVVTSFTFVFFHDLGITGKAKFIAPHLLSIQHFMSIFALSWCFLNVVQGANIKTRKAFQHTPDVYCWCWITLGIRKWIYTMGNSASTMQHSDATGRASAQECQRPKFDPHLGCHLLEFAYCPCDLVGFLWALWFPPTRSVGL